MDSNLITLDFLNVEREKIWARLVELEELVTKKTPEIEKEARQHSKKAAEFKNKCFEHKNTLESLVANVNTKINGIENSYASVLQKIDFINSTTETAQNCIELIDALTNKVDVIDSIYENKDDLTERLSDLESFYTSGKDLISKINAAFANINLITIEIQPALAIAEA